MSTASVSVEDYVELHQLMSRYAQGFDESDPEAFSACFTEDGVVELSSGLVEGVTALREWCTMPGVGGRHVPGGMLAEVDGDRATVRSYCIYHNGEAPPSVLSVLYIDEVVRIGGAWHIKHRNIAEIKGIATD